MIYLDNAATSFPKPPIVVREAVRCITTYCGNPGRGGHSLSLAAAKKVFECRSQISELVGGTDPEGIVFTQNTTHALNLVIKGLLKKGDHVIISDMEHNSVLRPVAKLCDEGIIEYSVFPTRTLEKRNSPTLICAGIARRIKPNTRAVICSHTSNVCSMSLPLKSIGEFCKKHGLYFIVDAAQSAGHLPIDMEKMCIDALCAPAHKALYGLQGAGFAALSPSLSSSLATLTEGGNGVNSFELLMPESSPERYEAGTLPTPSIAGLCEGIKYIRSIGLDAIREHESELYRYARELLLNTKGVTVYAPEHVGSVILFNKEGKSSEELARALNGYGICTRGGYHCSPLAHKVLGTDEGGAVRASFGIFNKKSEIDFLAKALNEIN